MLYYTVKPIEAMKFEGDLKSLQNDDGVIRVQHSMRGFFLRYPDKSMQPLKLGDYIITKPFFKVMPGKRFLEDFRPCASQGGSGDEQTTG